MKLFHNLVSKIIHLFRSGSILFRLSVVMLCLSILPSFFITWFSYDHYISEIESNTKQYLELLVKNISTQIHGALESYEYLMRSFYSDNSIMARVKENEEIYGDSEQTALYKENTREIQMLLWNLSRGNRYIRNFELITNTQQYHIENEEGYNFGAVVKDLDSFRHSKFYQKAIENKGYPVWFDTTSNTDAIYKFITRPNGIGGTFTVTTAVYAPGEKTTPIGILMLNVDMNFLMHSLTNYAFYGVGNTVLITDHVLTALNPNTNAPSLVYDAQTKETFESQEKGYLTQTINGSTTFVNFQKNPNMDLYVAHIVDMNTLLEEAYHIHQICIEIVVLLVVLCLIIAYLTTLSISLPLKELLDNMKTFEHDWGIKRCRVSGHDELTNISRHFNTMADATQKMSDKIIEERLKQQSLELRRTQAELNALQMQINPHFLYNTLDLIRWETIRIGDGENDASRMIDCFASLLRKSITKGENKVTIAEEIEHATLYLDVVNFAHTDKIDFVTSLSFDPRKYQIPKLSLQPLIENAIKHGMQKGVLFPTIRLRGRILEDHSLLITVTDNGNGMDLETLRSLQEKISQKDIFSENIGLRNVNQRFILCYGKEYGVSVSSVQNMGTEISLHFPAETI